MLQVLKYKRQLQRAKVCRDRLYWNVNAGRAGAALEEMNVSVTVPPGALERNITVTLVISGNKSDLPQFKNGQLNDDQRLVGPVVHCLPHGLHFKKPVTLLFDCSHTAVLPPNLQVWCSETGMNEALVWKGHESPVSIGQTKQCHLTIDHFAAFTIINTRTHREILADEFRVFVCATSCGNNSRNFEVCCVHDDVSAIEDAQKQLRYLDRAMNDSVGSIQMKVLPSRVINCPQVECSASPFSGNCPFLNDNIL
ncbi:hypothetical protein LSAT2_001257 [Lamellibrachia satsuma]|nr:hypothetical protein LSAT2_001257 [Lamellibrachia satsuma]